MMELRSTDASRRSQPVFLARRRLIVQPGRKQDYIACWRSAVASRLERQTGFITAWVLTAPDTDEVTIMSQWANEADYRAWCRSQVRCQVHAHIGGMVHQHLSESGAYVAHS